MALIDQSSVQNRLLRACSAADFALLQPGMGRITAELHQSLNEPYHVIRQVVFPDSGYVSIVTEEHGSRTEVGMVGTEGAVGATPVLLGSQIMPFRSLIQLAGEMVCVEAEALCRACDGSPALRTMMLRYVQSFIVQIAQTAYVNANHTIDARLCRWLLMCQDRTGGPELTLTHEFLSTMLAVQRTSVTLAVQVLEGAGHIRARRGRIEVRDRDALIEAAGDAYGRSEAEYARLMGKDAA